MNELRTKERNAKLRRELAEWQRWYVCLLILMSLALFAVAWMCDQRDAEARHWKEKYYIAQEEKLAAIVEYGALDAEISLERSSRRRQAEEFEALGKYQYIGKCQLTAYCCEPYQHICGTGDGLTATGIPVAPGMVAVDPEVIPLGSTVVIDGMEFLAADTGGAIEGMKLDLAFATHEEAVAFGVQESDVWIVAPEK